LTALVVLVVVAGGLIGAVPGLEGVQDQVGQIGAGWLLLAVALELLSGHGYVFSFAVVFPRGPLQFGTRMPWLHFVARVAWLEQGFQAVVAAGGGDECRSAHARRRVCCRSSGAAISSETIRTPAPSWESSTLQPGQSGDHLCCS
jgi:hypothetical protein